MKMRFYIYLPFVRQDKFLFYLKYIVRFKIDFNL